MSASRRPAFDIISHSPDQTRAIGAHLGKVVPRGSLLLLSGDIGAGKTTFVQGLARPLQTGDQIQSPTFTELSSDSSPGRVIAPVRFFTASSTMRPVQRRKPRPQHMEGLLGQLSGLFHLSASFIVR